MFHAKSRYRLWPFAGGRTRQRNSADDAGSGGTGAALHHILIEAVTSALACGQYPVKRIMGEPCVVEADVFRDGHDLIRAAIKWARKGETSLAEAPMALIADDRWRGEFVPPENARYVFTVEAWTDYFASWLGDFRKKTEAGRDVSSDLSEGVALIQAVTTKALVDAERALLDQVLSELRQTTDFRNALAVVSRSELLDLMARLADRRDVTVYRPMLEIIVERPAARFSAWYEMFPRSQGPTPGRHATLREAERRLSDIKDMGFDVVYLPPIHPIGTTNRKGPNNSLAGGTDSPGSCWAIGSPAGGHTAIEPRLGKIEDFDHFVATAKRLDLEVALDFAIQCSPDHPWVREHPGWFHRRPDGTIKYAENPPKEYQDVYPLNFDTADTAGLWAEMRRILLFWIAHGVRIFRVDNPHTKPIAFWEWLIAEIQAQQPEVIFLAEAFTRPKLMKALARAGFTQSYTYFTWRNSKAELTEYLTELTGAEMAEYFRPNFFVNTPDILSPVLQAGGRPAFKLRLVLAATMSPAYGIYSGYELCENEAVAGTEEYADSEKYEIRVRDWNRPGNIKEFVARVNAIRRENPALHRSGNLRFIEADNDQIICYTRTGIGGSHMILIAVNLDPAHAQECTVTVPPEAVGVAAGESYRVIDLLTGSTYRWSERNYVRLDPAAEPAHIFRVERFL